MVSAHMGDQDAGSLSLVASFPGLRALAWNGRSLYASRGYKLLCAQLDEGPIQWRVTGHYRPVWWRNISASTKLGFRLCRDGFHALTITPSGNLVAVVPGAIIALAPEETEFRITHRITRGTRPLHITSTPPGQLYWGEYFDNQQRDEVHIYTSDDQGLSWRIVYTFPQGSIRHVHNIVYDEWENCLWVLTGDNGDECRVLKTNFDFTDVETVLAGHQQARAVALIPAKEGVYFSSDTPFEANFIYLLDRRGQVSKIASLSSSSIYGCRVRNSLFFSTMAEPSSINQSNSASVYGSINGAAWNAQLGWKKDRWPMRLFQYGNIMLPDGNNATDLLALTTIALRGADLQMTLWRVLDS